MVELRREFAWLNTQTSRVAGAVRGFFPLLFFLLPIPSSVSALCRQRKLPQSSTQRAGVPRGGQGHTHSHSVHSSYNIAVIASGKSVTTLLRKMTLSNRQVRDVPIAQQQSRDLNPGPWNATCSAPVTSPGGSAACASGAHAGSLRSGSPSASAGVFGLQGTAVLVWVPHVLRHHPHLVWMEALSQGTLPSHTRL